MKSDNASGRPRIDNVAPHVGAWIEIAILSSSGLFSLSHPTWVRGLKFHTLQLIVAVRSVAPHVGAWIEIGDGRQPWG